MKLYSIIKRKRCVLLVIICCAMLPGCASLYRNPAWLHFVETSKLVRVAKRTYQLGHNSSIGTPVTWEDISTCLPSNWKPVCLKGGTMKPGKIGEEMKCSFHGQLVSSSSTHLRLVK
ncbi:MAG: hypothetical protein KAH23_05495 [Kiritimatiellae bacterium]|nr:hypothetical protein [Kiritimatiellia bacterium]